MYNNNKHTITSLKTMATYSSDFEQQQCMHICVNKAMRITPSMAINATRVLPLFVHVRQTAVAGSGPLGGSAVYLASTETPKYCSEVSPSDTCSSL